MGIPPGHFPDEKLTTNNTQHIPLQKITPPDNSSRCQLSVSAHGLRAASVLCQSFVLLYSAYTSST